MNIASIGCSFSCFEHITMFDFAFHISNVNIAIMYSYQSIIQEGYGDFSPFLTKNYTLAEIVSPITPLDYQEMMELITKNSKIR